LAGTAAGTVNRRFESSVTIMVGYSHYRPTVSTWAGEQKALAHFGPRGRFRNSDFLQETTERTEKNFIRSSVFSVTSCEEVLSGEI